MAERTPAQNNRNRRAMPRYDLSNFSELKASTEGGPIGEKLISLSPGGCGLVAPSEDFKLNIHSVVKLTIDAGKLLPQRVVIEGEVLYVVPHPLKDRIGRFYGIKFFDNQLDRIDSLVRLVENLCREGRIKLAD